VPEPEPPPAAETAPAPAVPLKSATEEREDARNALEHGKTADAIEAAARSVKVDPTDAEAWLLLGAANQEAGHSAEAHAAFVSCTKEAKTGNVAECGALLSWNGPR
jgi:Flp pilus assembly protein TadD